MMTKLLFFFIFMKLKLIFDAAFIIAWNFYHMISKLLHLYSLTLCFIVGNGRNKAKQH